MDPPKHRMSRPTMFEVLGEEIRSLWRDIAFSAINFGVKLRNSLRRARNLHLDYVVLPVGGPLPQRSGPPRGFIQRQLPLPPRPLSMETLNKRLQAIKDADNVKGVLFIFLGFSAGLATIQSLRRQIDRLKESGKEIVIYTPYLDLAHYLAASSADKIVVPPTAKFDVLGLHTEVIFIRDSLAMLGIEAEVLQISPYKDAYNMFDKSEISPEQEEQLNWLLDEIYETAIIQMAEGRGLEANKMRMLLDASPLSAEEAITAGLVDYLAYEDELERVLANGDRNSDYGQEDSREKIETEEQRNGKKSSLLTWHKARPQLLEKTRRRSTKYIGVVSLEGTIVMGTSRSSPITPPIPLPVAQDVLAGEYSVNQLLKRAEKDRHMAALIMYINSPGGSPLASDLIWRQLERIAAKKPIVVYMGDVAASGGYYVATPAHSIVAESLTITGSIGVLMAHFNTSGLFQKIGVNRVDFNRGARASLYSDLRPLSEDQREVLWKEITDTYNRFKTVVSEGRDLNYEELDPLCEGRVWMGSQALEHNLIDIIGDFGDAVQEAIRLAKLPSNDSVAIPIVNLQSPDSTFVIPQPFEPAETLAKILSHSRLRLMDGKPQLLMPFDIRFSKEFLHE